MPARFIWKPRDTRVEEGERTPEEGTIEEIKGIFCHAEPTNPNTLNWNPLIGLLKNRIRMRMKITEQNASIELLDACRKYIYPEEDVPEVKGLLKVLEIACFRAKLSYRLEHGPKGIQPGFVGFISPYHIHLPFRKARLFMAIAPGEFQWVMHGAVKEKPPLSNQLEIFKEWLLRETREWVRRGNR